MPWLYLAYTLGCSSYEVANENQEDIDINEEPLEVSGVSAGPFY